MIAAIGLRAELGLRGGLIWHIPEDLKHFKRVTMGRHLLLGRKTFESIGRPLPGRTSLILTRESSYRVEGCVSVHSVDEALEYAQRAGEQELMVCGGAEVYQALLPKADRLYLSRIQAEAEADAFFPHLEPSRWRLDEERLYPAQGRAPEWIAQRLSRREGH